MSNKKNLNSLAPSSSQILNLIPVKAAKFYKIFPLNLDDNGLVVAMTNPNDIRVVDDLVTITKSRIFPQLATEKDILDAINEFYGVGAETIEKMMTTVSDKEENAVESIDEISSEASISHFLNQVLLQAYKEDATDIHIEPFENQLRIRIRIDGVLQDIKAPTNISYFQNILISRIKIMSNLNIAEKRLPQDGRFKVRVEDQDLDLRVSFLPTPYGETCVIRILNSIKLYNLSELGITNNEQQTLNKLLKKSHGIIFLTGPTGSGKTTTLYSCLAQLNKQDTKIITIEDPIEYQLNGIIQIQVHPKIGLTFANGLRSILRSDPEIIMIGEVRDAESAQIAIQMSLTGHLVFSTLHTNDAASGITRLMDMGIEPYLIASSIECFMAQRLIRVLCPHCKKRTELTEEVIKEFNISKEDFNVDIYESRGCLNCRMSGYSGRQAICELLLLNDEIRSLITKRASSNEIMNKAISNGMKTLRQHGWEKVKAGLTSPSEVLNVTQGNA